jgi:hypothetical protein
MKKTEVDWSKFETPERVRLRQLLETLKAEYAESEIGTGKMLVEIRALTQPHGEMARFLDLLPLTARTAYRRIKSYEKAEEIWPKVVIDAAIEKKLKVVGWSQEKPLGLFEDVDRPPDNLTPHRASDYLDQAEMHVRLLNRRQTVEPEEALKKCFRMTEKATRSLSNRERVKFLDELVGLQMTLLGVSGSKMFESKYIPREFFIVTAGSPELRESRSKAAQARWDRIKA